MSSTLVARCAEEMFSLFSDHRRKDDSVDFTKLTIPEAYEAQAQFIARRVTHGARVVGWKVGCTSPAIRKQFGLSEAISGRLMEPDIFPTHSLLVASAYVNCAIEPELVFRLGAALEGDVSERQVAAAIATVRPGIELHNYRFWHGSPTWQELILSNGIHAGLVLGPELPFEACWDANSEEVSVAVNGETQVQGVSNAIMGSPLRSVAWLANHAASRGMRLEFGELVIPGSPVELVRVRAGDRLVARFSTLGSCHVQMV